MTTPIERGAEALMAPVHAPMNTHSGYDGSCVSCPWPLHEAETPEGITRAVFESIDVDELAEWLESNAICSNCDGRLCIGCIFREYDHTCADDCPNCCVDGQEIPLGVRLATAIKAHLLKEATK